MLWCLLIVLARAEVVDRVVAVVRGQPVLASDIQVDELLGPIDPAPVPFWTSGRPAQDTAIDAVIIRSVAEDIALYQPTREAVAERLTALRTAFGPRWPAFLGAHGLDQDRIELAIRRRMVVERFLLRSLQADPADRVRWLAEADAVLARLRQEIPVRVVPLRGEP